MPGPPSTTQAFAPASASVPASPRLASAGGPPAGNELAFEGALQPASKMSRAGHQGRTRVCVVHARPDGNLETIQSIERLVLGVFLGHCLVERTAPAAP